MASNFGHRSRRSEIFGYGRRTSAFGPTLNITTVPEVNEGHRQNPDKEMNSSPNAEGQKPEPKKNVDFFIYDIDSQNTETVLVFNSSGRTIVVECTLGDLKIKISKSLN